MARYTGPVCRLCRRDGTKLFLKGAKCFSEKCPVEKRNFPPGQHGQSRKVKKVVGYGLQLREKQKAKRIYFTLETQFRAYYQTASNKIGDEIAIRGGSKTLPQFEEAKNFAAGQNQVQWLDINRDNLSGKVLALP